MQIEEALLPTRSASVVAGFFDRLGCEVERDGPSVTVAIGLSRLRFVESDFEGAHHLAFTIPTGSFDLARRWLGQRVLLLSVDDRTEFGGPPSWDSRSMYFDGPDDQVLELIERRALRGGVLRRCRSRVRERDRRGSPGRPRRGRDPASSRPPALRERATSEFAAVGDVDGLLILVTPGRAWFPTSTRHVADTAVTVRTSVQQEVTLGAGKRLRPVTAGLGGRPVTD